MIELHDPFFNKVGSMSLNNLLLIIVALICFNVVASVDSTKNISFPKNGVKELKVSTPKGKIEIVSDSKSRDFKVSIKQLNGTQKNDEKKCVVETGIKGEALVISISSENILFDKATCEYEVKIIVPEKTLLQTSINSGTADINVQQVDNELSIKTAAGNVMVETQTLKNFSFTSATGSLLGKFKSCSSRADFDLITATGKMDLQLPKNCALRVDFKSATGKLFNSIGESKDYLLKINGKSASGDLSIL